MSELGLDLRSGDELRELLADSGYGAQFDELLDGPFQPKPRLRSRTGFSDGSFPVLYSSLDAATAEAEYGIGFHVIAQSLKSLGLRIIRGLLVHSMALRKTFGPRFGNGLTWCTTAITHSAIN